MAVFYVLPPRAVLGEALARFLRPYFPGLAVTGEGCAELLDAFAESQPAYFVHREDLADGEVIESLRDGFGLEAGDQVVQVGMGARVNEPSVRINLVRDAQPAGVAGESL